ncbi:MAG TPA: lysine 2,3-aminomutase, partial [Opitutus sp.]|nr:lysine 2,3-aminomutase [Opitutus sp.]
APGGGGKVPINPDYVEQITDDEVIFRNYEGKVFRYPLKSTPVVPTMPEVGVQPEPVAQPIFKS